MELHIEGGTFNTGKITIRCDQGPLTYTLRKTRYQETTGNIIVDTNTTVNVSMLPLFSTIHFAAEPEAMVTVVGKRMKTPFDLVLDTGLYTATASVEGYAPQQRTFRVGKGQEQTILFRPDPELRPTFRKAQHYQVKSSQTSLRIAL